jgi:hypothetical protein
MAVAIVTHTRRVDNTCAIQTLNLLEVEPGDTVTVAGVHANFDGTYTVLSIEPYALAYKDDEGYLVFDYDVPKGRSPIRCRLLGLLRRLSCRGWVLTWQLLTTRPSWLSVYQLLTHGAIGNAVRLDMRLTPLALPRVPMSS